MEVKLGVSNRHVHLSEEILEILFEGELTKKRDLIQTGHYASNETVDIKTDKGIIKNVRVLGPIRNYTQVEISKTDAYKLGINPPVRDSGDLKNAEKITIVSETNEVTVEECCIIANRHIHLTPKDVEKYGLEGQEKVSVETPGIKGGILNNVFLKVDESFTLELHLDTDDANANLLKTGDVLKVIK